MNMAGGTVNAVGRVLRIRARGTARNNNAGVAVTWELLVGAVASSDYPVAQGAFFIITVVLVFMNFIADLLYTVLDPRVSHGKRG